jgi:arginase
VEPPAASWRAEIRTAFDLAAGVADRVRAARAAGRFPLVLAGNCNAAIGVVAGLGQGTAVLWCDAHGDFNTPETTTGGFLDGMGLATVTGRCWSALAARVPGFAPVPESAVRLVGARDLDPLERAALERSAVRRHPAAALGPALADEVRRALAPTAPLYLHVDLDVLDPGEGRANAYAAPGGASAARLSAFCGALGARVDAATLASYDPAVDADGRVREAALALVDALLRRTDA